MLKHIPVFLLLTSSVAFARDYKADVKSLEGVMSKGTNSLGGSGQAQKYFDLTPDSSASKYSDGNVNGDAVRRSKDKTTTEGQASALVGKASPQKIDKGADWLRKAKSAEKLQGKELEKLLSQTGEQCRIVKGKVLPKENITLTCDVYLTPDENKTCNDTRDVRVSRAIKYSCSEQAPKELKECTRTLEAYCSQYGQGLCKYGGINMTNVNSDIALTYDANTGILHVGKNANGTWAGTCAVFQRSVKFNIPDASRVKNFILQHVGYDDWLSILVNGERVYAGPYAPWGFDEHWRYHRVVYGSFTTGYDMGMGIRYGTWRYWDGSTGAQIRSCELNAWRTYTPNTNIAHLLKDGENEIWTQTIVSGYGGFYAKFKVDIACCDTVSERWNEVCK